MTVRHPNPSCRLPGPTPARVLAHRLAMLEAELEEVKEDNRQLRAAVSIYAELAQVRLTAEHER